MPGCGAYRLHTAVLRGPAPWHKSRPCHQGYAAGRAAFPIPELFFVGLVPCRDHGENPKIQILPQNFLNL